jgi:hypothetical protein
LAGYKRHVGHLLDIRAFSFALRPALPTTTLGVLLRDVMGKYAGSVLNPLSARITVQVWFPHDEPRRTFRAERGSHA